MAFERERLMKIFAPAAVPAVCGTATLADTVESVWPTKKDENGNHGHVKMKPCGPAVCGTLVTAFKAKGQSIDSPNIGRQILWDMVPYPDGLCDRGRIHSPDRDAE